MAGAAIDEDQSASFYSLLRFEREEQRELHDFLGTL
jgi:hypothetical protein